MTTSHRLLLGSCPGSWGVWFATDTAQIAQDYGVRLQFHPHADRHVMTQPQVERFLSDTDPQYVSLCLDIGHLAYGRADSVQIITRFPSRIGYVHIKQMDPVILAKAEAEDLAFARAVAMGASCEPPSGLPDIPPVLAALEQVGAELFTVVEQDMYPCDFSKPKPIAARSFRYLNAAGLDAADLDAAGLGAGGLDARAGAPADGGAA